MKNIYRKAICIILTYAVMVSIMSLSASGSTTIGEPSPSSVNSKGISPISGTFIQPWLYSSWSDDRWDKEMENWKLLGIEYLIMGDTLMVDIANNYEVTASYPTRLAGAKQNGDVLTKLYEKCAEYNIKLYIGLGNALENGGWTFLDLEKQESVEKLKKVCGIFADVADDLYSIYFDKYKDAFAGFYFVPELYNNAAFDKADTRAKYVEGLASGLNIVLDRINKINPELPFIFSPYVNIFGGSWVTRSYDNIGLFWAEIMQKAHFRSGDIFCPQDSVGAGGMSVEKLDDMTKAYKKAVTDSRKGIRLWSNCEIFIQPKGDFIYAQDADGLGYWECAPIGRIVEQIKIVSKYVERVFVFAYPHYLSPYVTKDAFYKSYINYLETGKADEKAPTPPTKVKFSKANVRGKEVLQINWSGQKDDFAIVRMNIYKNGTLINYRITSRTTDGTPSYPVFGYDSKFDFTSKEKVTYELEPVDSWGNTGEKIKLELDPAQLPLTIDLTPGESSQSFSQSTNDSVNTSTDNTVLPSGKSNILKYSLFATGILAVAGVIAGIIFFNRKKKK